MKLRERPISAVLIEAALTNFTGIISVAGVADGESIAIDVHMESGEVTNCTGLLGDRKIDDEECLRIAMAAECTNCGAQIIKLPSGKVIRKYRRPVLAKELTVSEQVDDLSGALRERARVAEIMLKGRMALYLKASIRDGLRALAELSANKTAAMLATVGDSRFVVMSSKSEVIAAYLRKGGSEYLGSEALSKALNEIDEYAVIQVFLLPQHPSAA